MIVSEVMERVEKWRKELRAVQGRLKLKYTNSCFLDGDQSENSRALGKAVDVLNYLELKICCINQSTLKGDGISELIEAMDRADFVVLQFGN